MQRLIDAHVVKKLKSKLFELYEKAAQYDLQNSKDKKAKYLRSEIQKVEGAIKLYEKRIHGENPSGD